MATVETLQESAKRITKKIYFVTFYNFFVKGHLQTGPVTIKFVINFIHKYV